MARQRLTKEQQKELTKICKHLVVYNDGLIGNKICEFGYMVCVGCDREIECRYFVSDIRGRHCKHPAIYTKLKVGGILLG